MTASHAAVTQELLVRYLDAWTPAALHGARRATYAAAGADESAVAALRVFGEFSDRLARHGLAMVLAAPNPETARVLGERLAAVHREVGAPAELTVHVASGELVDLLSAQRSLGAPVFAYIDGTAYPPADDTLRVLGRNKGTEIVLTLDAATAGDSDRPSTVVDRYRSLLAAAGLPEVLHVELVDGDGLSRLLLFATANAKHLEKFKDELWSVDEFAGVRYRDPHDDGGTLVDISFAPDVGPLRRAVIRHVTAAGALTTADLRHFTHAETLYRTADLNRVLPPLLTAGLLVREPAKGRLTPETVIRPGRPGRG
jgi:hypothetical protein